MAANVESMFYTRTAPWHGLGVRVEEVLGSKEALIQAGLDWKVEQTDVYAASGERIPGYKANIRDIDRSVLGIVGDRYKISYDENGKVIKSLEIRNQKNEIVCQFNMGNKVSKQAFQTANKNQLSDYRMGKLYDEMKRTGVTEQQIVERFHVSLANLTERDYKKIMSALKNTDTRAA